MIRPATSADASAIAAIYAPIVERTAISFEVVAPSTKEMAKRIAELVPSHPFLVAELSGQVIGYAYSSPHRQRSAYRFAVDVTVYVGEAARRTGVGRTLYRELIARLDALGLHRAYAGIALPNDGSIGLHEAMGFRHIGTYHEVGYKFGRWYDVGWWELALDDEPPDRMSN